VVEDVPGDAAGCITRRPALLGDEPCSGGSAQGPEDGVAKGRDRGRGPGGRRVETDPQLARILRLGAENMLNDGVAVATSAAWALAQLGRRAGDYPVEDGP